MAVVLPSDSDVATLARTDFGEALLVDGVACTGTLVLNVPQVAEEPAGTDRRRRATVRVATTIAVAFRSQVKRVSDATWWHVDAAPDTEYGERVCTVVSAQRQSEGRL